MGDEEILQALENLTQLVKSRVKAGGDDPLAGMDAGNQVKDWSGLSLVRGPDDRPDMKAKNYLIEKLALGDGQEMPHDSSGSYAKPF